MSYVPTENGTKVNMIKQKFERKIYTNNKDNDDNDDKKIENDDNDDDQKEHLRRSLSASPIKGKKNLKLNVTRQLSSPAGKNIKRTPAFRGDKLTRIKNLNSPIKEKINSIVDHNVKMFEEKPEYGIIGNVKKKTTFDYEKINIDVTDSGEKINNCNWRPPLTKDTRKFNENTVRTTVISRQKNISPMYTHFDDDFVPTVLSPKNNNEDNENVISEKLNKFLMNGVEYTRVAKIKETTDDNKHDKLCDDLSLENIIKNYSIDNSNDLSSKKLNNEETRLKLTDSLKAALEAPLPTGPAPKKPPRTFAHSPLTQRYRPDHHDDNNQRSSWLHEEFTKKIGIDIPDFSKSSNHLNEVKENDDNYIDIDDFLNKKQDKNTIPSKKNDSRNNLSNLNSKINSSSDDSHDKSSPPLNSKPRSIKDSKKMLEKLEAVLIQHKKGLGPKVIIPRKDKNDIEIGFETRKKSPSKSENDLEKRVGKIFLNHLSNTLDEPKKQESSLTKNYDLKIRKQSTFDCLPYLNCASASVYEQPSFKNYLTDNRSKSEDSLSDSISNILSSNNDLYDDLLSPAAKRLSTELTTFSDGKRRQSSSTISEERVYAEPFSFDKNSGTDITQFTQLSPEEHNYFSKTWRGGEKNNEKSDELNNSLGRKNKELHYMCTPIDSTVLEYNNNCPENIGKLSRDKVSFQSYIETTNSSNISRPSLAGLDKIKAEHILNQAFGQFVMAGSEISVSTDSNPSSDTDSLASTPSIGDESTSFNDKLRLFKNRDINPKISREEVQRNLTEKRKNYVRKVSMKYSESYEPSIRGRRDQLFEVCLLVGLNLSNKKPYIKDKYPVYATAPAWIENFCFPDAQDWPPTDSNSNQSYSLFLMDEKGNRRHGYCCRVKPEGGPILPLAYCLITKHRAAGFYHKVLLELESKHGLPDIERRNFMEKLYNSTMPKPGNSLRMTNNKLSNETTSNNNNINTNNNNNNNNNIVDNNLLKLMSEFVEKKTESLIDSDNTESIIMRLGDPRLEGRDMSLLFDAVSNKVLIYLFGCLLLERKVVLMSSGLSKLSSCIEALQSLLNPFTWPHTFIPVLPDISGLSTILEAPLPFVIGILKSKNFLDTDVNSIEDGIVVDLDTSKIICAVGDELSILPSKLQKGIRSALQLITSNTKSGDGVRNFLVSEAFLRVFVETCAHLEGHLVSQQDGKVLFQKESFIKASNSKAIQYFLEWFVETTMFNAFVNDYIGWIEGSTVGENNDIKLFAQRVAEYQKTADKNAQSKSSKKKTFGDRLKDLTNFYT